MCAYLYLQLIEKTLSFYVSFMPGHTHSIYVPWKWLSFTEALAGSQEFFLERLGYGAQESAGVNSVAWSKLYMVNVTIISISHGISYGIYIYVYFFEKW